MAKNIYLYLGDERVSIEKKIENRLLEIKANEYSITNYDLDEVNIADVMRDAITPPFMSDKKIIIIRNPRFLTSEKLAIEHKTQAFYDYIINPMDTTHLIIDAWGIKLDSKKDYVQKLLAVAEVNESRELSDVELQGWLKRYCMIADVTIHDEQIKEFFALVGKNMLNAKNEADKLINYVGPNGKITTDIVQSVVIKEMETNVFSLSNAIIEKNKAKVIGIYRDLMKNDNDTNNLFNLIARTMKDNLIVNIMLKNGYKQADIAALMNVSSGRAYHLVRNSKSLNIDEVEKYIVLLGELDYKIKSGLTDSKTGLEFFLFGL